MPGEQALQIAREALLTADAWLDRWAVHVGDCRGDDLSCTCGLARVRWETTTALAALAAEGSEEQAITSTPDIQGGEPCIAGTRIPARAIKSFANSDYTIEAIRREYPTLSAEQVLAAIDYDDAPTRTSPSAAQTVVRAVLDAEVAFADDPTDARSIGYYFRVGLDHFRRYDEMHDRLVAAAELAVSDALTRTTPSPVSQESWRTDALGQSEGHSVSMDAKAASMDAPDPILREVVKVIRPLANCEIIETDVPLADDISARYLFTMGEIRAARALLSLLQARGGRG